LSNQSFRVCAFYAAGGSSDLLRRLHTVVDRRLTLGVASGDPTADGVVLWTRLALKPLEGNGGMPDRPVAVQWRIAADERMWKVVGRGTAWALPALGHSVHVEVQGLKPGRWYFFQFKVGDEYSPVGRTRTAPALNAAAFRRSAWMGIARPRSTQPGRSRGQTSSNG
jgi:phosphodiesterase/alkaline phosphatase D-like protein